MALIRAFNPPAAKIREAMQHCCRGPNPTAQLRSLNGEPRTAQSIRCIGLAPVERKNGDKLMKNFEYTIQTAKSVDHAVQAVEQITLTKGFRVLHVHDVAATLAEKGFAREPLKIIEICSAKYAHEVLQKDIRTAFMLPCPIIVYARDGKTHIGTMLPGMMKDFFPKAGIEAVADLVEKVALEIVNEAAR